MTFVSVIIPVYNGARFLAEAIESVLAQTHCNLELIMVDDGSTDRSAEIALAYAKRDSRIQVARQSNHGASSARNWALHLAKGEWIACLDSDDVMLPHRLERQLAFITLHPEVRVLGSVCRYINADGLPRGGHTIGAPIRSRSDLDALLDTGQLIGLTQPSVMMHRPTILALGGYDTAMEPAEDLDLWMRVAQAGHLVLQDTEVLTCYRVHGTSLMGTQAAKGSRMGRLIAARAAARRSGRQEPTLDDFLVEQRSRPLWQRLKEARQHLGWIYYRRAGTALTNSRWLAGVLCLAAAFCLRPVYVAGRLARQLRGVGPAMKEEP